jgi:RNA 3'-terminal phosphate cyclase
MSETTETTDQAALTGEADLTAGNRVALVALAERITAAFTTSEYFEGEGESTADAIAMQRRYEGLCGPGMIAHGDRIKATIQTENEFIARVVGEFVAQETAALEERDAAVDLYLTDQATDGGASSTQSVAAGKGEG